MNAAHWHLIVNHIPIMFPIVGTLVLLFGLFTKAEAVKRTAYMIFIIGTIGAAVASKTGEAAEEMLETTSAGSENFMHNHEEVAEIFTILSGVLAAISIIGLWAGFKQMKHANKIAIVTLLYTLVVLFFARQTGTTGGEIKHPEIRSQYTDPGIQNVKPGSADDD